MTAVTGPADWRDLEQGAPELARLGPARLHAAGVAMLGTLRPDGSPRISPIEPHLVRGQLLVGAMAWSTKAADLLRDPRYVLHSAVTGPDNGEGELKLHGSAIQAGGNITSCRHDGGRTNDNGVEVRTLGLQYGGYLPVTMDGEHLIHGSAR